MIDNKDTQLSVVIGFRNWGTDRLHLVIETLSRALEGLRAEIIVSDFGSDDPERNRRVCTSAGAEYVYTPTTGPWSRARALNIGFAHSSGKVIVCTDADMLFRPGSLRKIYEILQENPHVTALLECRDLPPDITEEAVATNGPDWNLFESIARLRGRWGMGGMIAVTRETVERLRGLDERMHTYGSEDLDFGQRTQRAGNRLMWIEDPEVRMYHLWHPSPDRSNDLSPELRTAIEQNRAILYKDPSMVRNRTAWLGQDFASKPIVTVGIATRNRAALLRETLLSILAQTVTDLEVVIVDDGGEDFTAEMIQSLGDTRLRYVWQPASGIAAARNRITAEAKGYYVAVIDDDDLMPAHRIDYQLQAMTAGVGLVYGSFVNFREDGELKLFSEQDIDLATALQKGGAPGHSTWMVDRRVLEKFPYDESIPSGEDNELFLRLLRNGIKVAHSGIVCVMRRLHTTQVTQTDNRYHEGQAAMNFVRLRFAIPDSARQEMAASVSEKRWVDVLNGRSMFEAYGSALPDSLVCRRGLIWASNIHIESHELDGTITRLDLSFRRSAEDDWLEPMIIDDMSLRDQVTLRRLGVDFEIIQHWPQGEESLPSPGTSATIRSYFGAVGESHGMEITSVGQHDLLIGCFPSFAANPQFRDSATPPGCVSACAPIIDLEEGFHVVDRLMRLGALSAEIRHIKDIDTAVAAMRSTQRSH